MPGEHHIFGIRHHGPGCARSLVAALEALDPDCVLIEGPPDAEGVVPLTIDPAMRPPVALLIYPDGAPERAAYYPFAEFSPEWQAILFALREGIAVRFMDLPLSHRYAEEDRRRAEAEAAAAAPQAELDIADEAEAQSDADASDAAALRVDPLGVLSEAAGYSDRELWWEHQVEQRIDPAGLFEGILEAMTALREQHPPPRPDSEEARREAYMRKTIRAARKEHARIAVVCGAWHAPALVDVKGSKADAAILKGMKKTKVVATWIPWTYDRLTYQSGYGAGVASPGWYQHLFAAPDRAAIRWATRAARLLRAKDLDASSAGVIEVVRLAEALAALRELPLPGLAELREALGAVLCHGDPTPLALITRELEVGAALGEVPEGAPTVPLHKDLLLRQKRLRLKLSADPSELNLDLRKERDLEKSTLLHRLRLLDIDWGERTEASGEQGKGSFRERWTYAWRPELAVKVIEANIFGNTVEEAAIERIRRRAASAELSELTLLLEALLPADLAPAMAPLLARLQAVAAVTADIRELMKALPPLARICRYGDVRGAHEAGLRPVVDGLLERILVGLPPACAAIDDEAAAAMVDGLGEVHEGVRLLDRDDLHGDWLAALASLTGNEAIHARIRGRSARLRLELGALDEDQLGVAASLALSRAVSPADAAAWAEGLLRGSGLLLVHQDAIWRVLDAWLADLSSDDFAAVLPLLRRAFAEFTDPERRQMGAKVKSLGGAAASEAAAAAAPSVAVDHERAARTLPVLRLLLGVDEPAPTNMSKDGGAEP
ncbi:MAG: DUF5682 family protein [Nannocystaceae bacterium]